MKRVDSIGTCEILEESFSIAKSSGIRFRVGRVKGCEAHCQNNNEQGKTHRCMFNTHFESNNRVFESSFGVNISLLTVM